MRKSRIGEEQIVGVLKEAEAEVPIADCAGGGGRADVRRAEGERGNPKNLGKIMRK